MKSLIEIARDLHKINFGKDGIIPMRWDGADYDYNEWKSNDAQHKYSDDGCCNECREFNNCVLNCNYNNDDNKYKFTNVSHGTHMVDFLNAHGSDLSSVEKWSTYPVMFVMENPSNCRNNSYAGEVDNNNKRPTKSWYWLNESYDEKDDKFVYPHFFDGHEYGKLVYSIMKTFHIANGYLTNMVKCGVGYYQDKYDVYTTTEKYNTEIIKKCIRTRLQKELTALRGGDDNKVIIFAFGLNTYNFLCEYLLPADKDLLYLLPHPASRLANDYRKYVLFAKIARALYINEFYKNREDFNFMEVLRNDDAIPNLKINKDHLEKLINNIPYFNYDENDEITRFAHNLEIKNADNYKAGKLSYYIIDRDHTVQEFTLMYKTKSAELLEDGIHKTIWVNYNLFEDEIQVWCGKDKKSDNRITSENCEQYVLYKIMRFLVDKIRKTADSK